MTEHEWLAATTKPMAMFRFVRARLHRRTKLLLGCACCRLFWDDLDDSRSQFALETAERFADRQCEEELFAEASRLAWEVHTENEDRIDQSPSGRVSLLASGAVATLLLGSGHSVGSALAWVQSAAGTGPHPRRTEVRRRMCELIREIVGNPFRPWAQAAEFAGGGLVQPDGCIVALGESARSLAQAIKIEQAFERLPILADAVEECGLTDPEILLHLRQDSAHVRGCWALDCVAGAR
ncbi:MAG: hypothetical protein LC104_04605 [Bacteroidales bacterium]|nr:hypothetical protein [Bacteroidales bacterium]